MIVAVPTSFSTKLLLEEVLSIEQNLLSRNEACFEGPVVNDSSWLYKGFAISLVVMGLFFEWISHMWFQ